MSYNYFCKRSNQDTHILQVYDNGHGMSVENLESLFHIAKSSKRYGEIVCGNRYQQGEKGLGLLAVFKFGNSVTWKTTHQSYSEILELSVERNKLIELEDITEHIIPVTTKDKDDDFNGTLLSIDCSQDNDLHMIENFFKSDINTKKFINLFNDSGIDVTFKLFKDKNKEVKSNKTSLNQAMKNSDKLTIFDIELDLKKNTLITFKKGSNSTQINFTKKTLPSNITLQAKLKILSLKGSSVKNVDSLFQLVRSKQSSLRPLLYINKVLFNNYDLFNPEISRAVQSGKSLPQIIGYLDLVTTNPKVSFNPDRTQLIENSVVSGIESYLLELNLFIQEEASKLRKNGFPVSPNSNQSGTNQSGNNQSGNNQSGNNQSGTNQSGTNQSGTNQSGTNQSGTNQSGNNPGTSSTNLASISLLKRQHTVNFYHSSSTLDLMEFMDNAFDSHGKKVNPSDISVFIDGLEDTNKSISNISNSTTKIVVYKFIDDNMTIVSDELKVFFKQQILSLKSSSSSQALIKSFSHQYDISLPIVGELIEQINDLWLLNQEYKVIIATSLRVIFELSCSYLESHDSSSPVKVGLEDKIYEAIVYIKKYKGPDNKFYENFCNSYKTFNNVFNPNDFKDRVKKSNLGSHFATDKLDKDDIETIAKSAGYFAQLVDAYLKDKGYI